MPTGPARACRALENVQKVLIQRTGVPVALKKFWSDMPLSCGEADVSAVWRVDMGTFNAPQDGWRYALGPPLTWAGALRKARQFPAASASALTWADVVADDGLFG
jgi:hypothetical protein